MVHHCRRRTKKIWRKMIIFLSEKQKCSSGGKSSKLYGMHVSRDVFTAAAEKKKSDKKRSILLRKVNVLLSKCRLNFLGRLLYLTRMQSSIYALQGRIHYFHRKKEI